MLTLSLLIALGTEPKDSIYIQAAKQAVALEAQYGIEAELLLAIAKVESNFKVNAVGASHGEVGLMQLRPNFFPSAIFDVKTNMRIAARHLSQIRAQCQKKYGDAWWVCYNIGHNRPAALNAKAVPYYKKVKAAYVQEKRSKKTAAGIRNRMRPVSSYCQTSNP